MDTSKKKNLKGVELMEVNLEGANLQGANLKWTYFIRANFKETKLDGATLEGADLEGAQHLSLYQLSKVKTLHAAKLDEDLRITLQEKYPALFEGTK